MAVSFRDVKIIWLWYDFNMLDIIIWLWSLLYNIIYLFYTGWWYTYPSEKYKFVNWDDDIPNW
jgi:hypothetical protein